MINYQQFKKLKELQNIGVAQYKISKELGISNTQVSRWWNKTEDEFVQLNKLQERYLDNYKEFILDQIRITPQIRQTNIYYKLQERFPDFEVRRSTFYRYMKQLRIEQDLPQFPKRVTSIREKLQPGEEAQSDFGQFKLKTMYGTNAKVYFFCMVLSYSNMRFVHFEPQLFTTKTAIKAHNFAFQYFGGRTRQIMYDMDNVFVWSHNYGDIILVKEFEEFVRTTGFQTIFCKPRDPQTKGRVEQLVRFVKENFLEGRTYYGIDSLNSDCLKWLDTSGNETISKYLGGSPRDWFRQEQKHLVPVTKSQIERKIYSVTRTNTILYKSSNYELPLGTNLIMDKVGIEEQDGILIIRNLDGDELCCHQISLGHREVIKLKQASIESVSSLIVRKTFEHDEIFKEFLVKLKEQLPRHADRQAMAINRATKFYTKEQLHEAFEHCIAVNNCNITELMAFLIWKHGKDSVRRFLTKDKIYYCSKRAKELEVLHGN